MKLYELKKNDLFKLDAESYDGYVFKFDHVDGMYSVCHVAEGTKNSEGTGWIGEVVHLAVYAPVIKLPSSSG